MPRISSFYGIIISMYADDHLPPHFHVKYGEYEAQIDLDGNVMIGEFPANKLKLVQAWVLLHMDELVTNWQLVRNNSNPEPIDPLR